METRGPRWFKLKLERRALLEQLPPEVALRVLLGGMDFLETGETPEDLDPLGAVAFSAFRPDFEESRRSYEQRIENGKKGGRPRQEKPSGTEETECPTQNHMPPHGTEEETEPEPETETEAETETGPAGRREGETAARRRAAGREPPRGRGHAPPAPARSARAGGTPVRRPYGSHRNVLLTDAEHETLRRELPDAEALIERLSLYMASTGRSYRSHAATLRSWALRAREKGAVDGSTVTPARAELPERIGSSLDDLFDGA